MDLLLIQLYYYHRQSFLYLVLQITLPYFPTLRPRALLGPPHRHLWAR
jgi:hypothetical protein